MTASSDMIRPWWPGRDGDHVNVDCPLLKAETDTPAEGSGWLDPKQSTRLCPSCFAWNAECTRCWTSLAEENGGSAKDMEAAQEWADDHICPTTFDFTAAVRPPAVPDPPSGQQPLFPLADLIAVEAAA